MSNLPGNPHAAIAHRAKNLNAMARGGGEDRPDLLVRMQAEATLALAYEQRTANLIAYWNALAGDAEPWQDTPFQRELDDMHRDIRTRLGRTAEVPK